MRKLSSCSLLTLTFFVTGAFDALLQLAMHGYAPPIVWLVGKSDWYIALTKEGGYFDQHTPLAAILLAGIVGALAQSIIISIISFPTQLKKLPLFLFVTFVISALVGLLMNDAWPTSTRLFPIISDTYYKDLGKIRSMITDGESRLIVNLTIIIMLALVKKVTS